jgi:putative oxidoreductase
MNGTAVVNSTGTSRWNAALVLLRIASGVVFLYHGAAIMFSAFGGPGPAGFAAHNHMPLTEAYFVGLAQLAGGLAILTGVLLRVGTVFVMIVMAGAIFTVHLPKGFDIAHNGMEYAFTQFLVAFALLLTGAGAYSLGVALPETLRKL